VCYDVVVMVRTVYEEMMRRRIVMIVVMMRIMYEELIRREIVMVMMQR
jgi:hypothetical protein